MVRRPAFDADITPGTGTTVRLVAPYATRTLDRWGNVRGTQEGGYQVVNGQPTWAPSRIFRSYRFDDNYRVITESLGTYGYTSSSGVSTNAMVYNRFFRDLLGYSFNVFDDSLYPHS